jgi:hypothetical protein
VEDEWRDRRDMGCREGSSRAVMFRGARIALYGGDEVMKTTRYKDENI